MENRARCGCTDVTNERETDHDHAVAALSLAAAMVADLTVPHG